MLRHATLFELSYKVISVDVILEIAKDADEQVVVPICNSTLASWNLQCSISALYQLEGSPSKSSELVLRLLIRV